MKTLTDILNESAIISNSKIKKILADSLKGKKELSVKDNLKDVVRIAKKEKWFFGGSPHLRDIMNELKEIPLRGEIDKKLERKLIKDSKDYTFFADEKGKVLAIKTKDGIIRYKDVDISPSYYEGAVDTLLNKYPELFNTSNVKDKLFQIIETDMDKAAHVRTRSYKAVVYAPTSQLAYKKALENKLIKPSDKVVAEEITKAQLNTFIKAIEWTIKDHQRELQLMNNPVK